MKGNVDHDYSWGPDISPPEALYTLEFMETFFTPGVPYRTLDHFS